MVGGSTPSRRAIFPCLHRKGTYLKTLTAFKILVLVLSLATVIYAMRAIRQGSLDRFFQTLESVPNSSSKGTKSLDSSEKEKSGEPIQIHLCKNRVHAMVLSDGHRIFEKRNGLDLKWMAESGADAGSIRELNYLDIEKWLGQHCAVDALRHDMSPGEILTFEGFLTIEFIDGTKIDILKSGENLFKVDELVFQSTDLNEALTELQVLAGWIKFDSI